MSKKQIPIIFCVVSGIVMGVVYLFDRILSYNPNTFHIDKVDVEVALIVFFLTGGVWIYEKYRTFIYNSKQLLIVKNRPFFIQGGLFTAPPFVFIVLVIFFVIVRLMIDILE